MISFVFNPTIVTGTDSQAYRCRLSHRGMPYTETREVLRDNWRLDADFPTLRGNPDFAVSLFHPTLGDNPFMRSGPLTASAAQLASDTLTRTFALDRVSGVAAGSSEFLIDLAAMPLDGLALPPMRVSGVRFVPAAVSLSVSGRNDRYLRLVANARAAGNLLGLRWVYTCRVVANANPFEIRPLNVETRGFKVSPVQFVANGSPSSWLHFAAAFGPSIGHQLTQMAGRAAFRRRIEEALADNLSAALAITATPGSVVTANRVRLDGSNLLITAFGAS